MSCVHTSPCTVWSASPHNDGQWPSGEGPGLSGSKRQTAGEEQLLVGFGGDLGTFSVAELAPSSLLQQWPTARLATLPKVFQISDFEGGRMDSARA